MEILKRILGRVKNIIQQVQDPSDYKEILDGMSLIMDKDVFICIKRVLEENIASARECRPPAAPPLPVARGAPPQRGESEPELSRQQIGQQKIQYETDKMEGRFDKRSGRGSIRGKEQKRTGDDKVAQQMQQQFNPNYDAAEDAREREEIQKTEEERKKRTEEIAKSNMSESELKHDKDMIKTSKVADTLNEEENDYAINMKKFPDYRLVSQRLNPFLAVAAGFAALRLENDKADENFDDEGRRIKGIYMVRPPPPPLPPPPPSYYDTLPPPPPMMQQIPPQFQQQYMLPSAPQLYYDTSVENNYQEVPELTQIIQDFIRELDKMIWDIYPQFAAGIPAELQQESQDIFHTFVCQNKKMLLQALKNKITEMRDQPRLLSGGRRPRRRHPRRRHTHRHPRGGRRTRRAASKK